MTIATIVKVDEGQAASHLKIILQNLTKDILLYNGFSILIYLFKLGTQQYDEWTGYL